MKNFKEKLIQYLRDHPPKNNTITLEVKYFINKLVNGKIYSKI